MANVVNLSRKRRQPGRSAAAPKQPTESASQTALAAGVAPAGWRSPAVLALSSSVLLWAAFPPLGFWPLAWIAPCGWLALCRTPEPLPRRAYLVLWFSGVLYWVLMLEGVRLAHWANYFGLAALAMYLAVYLPLFVALTRVAIHVCRVPPVAAAPMIWTGLELARGYLLTGFSMGLLGHSQVSWTALLQIADLFGAYGVGFLMIMGSATIVFAWPFGSQRRAALRALPWAVCFLSALGYGHWRLNQVDGRSKVGRADGDADRAPTVDSSEADLRPLRVALIQGSMDTIFEYNPARKDEGFQQYTTLTREALAKHGDLDLVIWPESAFTANLPDGILDGHVTPPPGVEMDGDEYGRQLELRIRAFQEKARWLSSLLNPEQGDGSRADADTLPKDPSKSARSPENSAASRRPTHAIVGSETWHLSGTSHRQYNSALWIAPEGEIAGRYYKMHPVMFGEYIPFGEVFPWIYRLSPLGGGLSRGTGPASFKVAGWQLAPSICFESTVPHLIRRHVQRLRSEGRTPDALVNVTDDGWFRGSGILDLQLAGGVFRAIENRRPFLVAANTGISAVIDGSGHILARGPRRATAVLTAEVPRDGRSCGYLWWGDFWSCACLAGAIVVGAVGIRHRRLGRTAPDLAAGAS